MSDTPWLQDLAQVNREREAEERSRLDERWDRLSAGELTPEEEAELIALAGSSEEDREAYEAFRPLGAEFQARVVSAVAAELEHPAPPVEARKPRPRILPFRPALTQYGGWLTAAATVAAALFLVVHNPAALPPLPTYTANLDGGVQTYRGESDPARGLQVFVPGSLLTVEVRPEQAVTGPVEAQAFLARDTDIVLWKPEPPLAVSPQGMVRLRGKLGQDIRLEPGDWRIWLVVGRRGKLPPADKIVAELRAGRIQHTHWQAVFKDLRVADHASP